MEKNIFQTIRLHSQDNCVVLTRDVTLGEKLIDYDQIIESLGDIQLGHKIASSNIRQGDKIYKYGASIGVATTDIKKGDHVHLHNMQSDYLPTFTIEADKDNQNA